MRRAVVATGMTALALASASCAYAHPHVHIDAAVTLRTNAEGLLEAIQVEWIYGSSDSQAILETRGYLDDGAVTPDELEKLVAEDIHWDEVPEDVEVKVDEQIVELGPFQDHVASYDSGRITLSHTHWLLQPLPPQEVEVRAYDPTFYIAYSLVAAETANSECQAAVEEADLALAGEKLGEAFTLQSLSPEDAEQNFPEVGVWFADVIRVTCP